MTALSSLPPEVLGEIISCCTAYNADAPLVLASVNRTFYEVAHSSPAAWRKLRLRLGTGDEIRQIRKAGLWLKEAGACRIDLFINITNPSIPTDLDTLPAGTTEEEWFSKSHSFLAAFIRHHRSRIQALTLQSDTEMKAFYFLDAISSAQSDVSSESLQLHSLWIQITNDIPSVPSGWSPVFETFSLFPRLDSLKLINHILPALSTPNIQHLRALSIVRPLSAPPLPTHKILRMISSAPSLDHLDIDSRISGQPVEPDAFQIQAPALKSLSLRVNNLPFLLNLLAPPSLEVLRLKDLDGRRHAAGEELGRVMESLTKRVHFDGSRGLDRLKIFEVSGIHVAEPMSSHWDWCMRRLPGLEALTLSNFDCASLVTVLTEISGRDLGIMLEDDFYCPRLSYVCFSGLGALPPLQKLKTKRPRLRIEWDHDRTHERSLERFHQAKPFSYAATGFGFGSSFDSRRKDHHAVTETSEREVALDDIDSSW